MFISHSVGTVENPIVNHLSASLFGAGVPNYLAMYDRQPGVRLSKKVTAHIEESSILVAVLTQRGQDSSWVHDEIGYALGRKLRVVSFIENGLKLDGLHAGVEEVYFDPKDPAKDIAILSERIARERAEKAAAEARADAAESDQATQNAEIAAVIIVVAAIFVIAILASRK